MTRQTDLTTGVDGVLGAAWDIRDGQVVPTTDTVKLKDGAVKVDATYLYADMAGSSKLAQLASQEITGKVIRSYLNAATRVLGWHGGAIRSFDGDRVMAIFMGNQKNTNAVKAAMMLNWAVDNVLKPKINGKWPVSLKDWNLYHGVGIDTGAALIVRGGVRNNNDLVSIGSAPNVAAKLSELRDAPDIYISKAVYDRMMDVVKLSNGTNVWTKRNDELVGGRNISVYGSLYGMTP